MAEEKAPKLDMPNLSEFCLSVPLYKAYELDESLKNRLYHLVTAAENIDCYCVDCRKHSVFNGETIDLGPSYNFNLNDRLFIKKFSCSRFPSHLMYFFFQIKAKHIFKIGQSPSHADISMPELMKYRKVLAENDDYKEFHRSVGLSAHGIGIGAFVYLRRIFEKLIEKAHGIAQKQAGWDESVYQSSRISERIVLLKEHLPEFLVQQKALYGILSKGIHELTEQDCLEAFPAVKLGIELILDEELEKQKRADKLKAAAAQIALLTEKHK